MRKSRAITLGIVSLTSLALLAGCATQQSYTRRCVDANDRLLPDSRCSSGAGTWIFMGAASRFINGRATGYSRSMPPNGMVRTSSGSVIRGGSTSRGGFGSSGRGFFGG